MLFIFILTMLKHYQEVDVEYLGYATLLILGVALIPSILGNLIKIQKRIIQVGFGAFMGPAIAALLIYAFK